VRTAAALIIGNEILTGKTADTNLLVMARTLRELGISLERALIVRDDVQEIAQQVLALSAGHDLVLTSGGLGPTHDDVTVDAVAQAFGVATIIPAELRAEIERHAGAELSDGHLRMARVPDGARLVRSGRASWPTIVMRNVWLFPGVPQVLSRKMSLLRTEFADGTPFSCLRLRTKLDECVLKPLLDAVVQTHPEVQIGSYPHWHEDGYYTEITFDAGDDRAARAARDALEATLPAGTELPLDD